MPTITRQTVFTDLTEQQQEELDNLVASWVAGASPIIWAASLLDKIQAKLETRSRWAGQAAVFAACRSAADGVVTRDEAKNLAGYPADRALKGFTRPINGIVEQMKKLDEIPADAPRPFVTLYDRAAPGQALGFQIVT